MTPVEYIRTLLFIKTFQWLTDFYIKKLHDFKIDKQAFFNNYEGMLPKNSRFYFSTLDEQNLELGERPGSRSWRAQLAVPELSNKKKKNGK